jgi:hypothetical protein
MSAPIRTVQRERERNKTVLIRKFCNIQTFEIRTLFIFLTMWGEVYVDNRYKRCNMLDATHYEHK